GTYTPLDDPLASFMGTVATGINHAGQIVGYYYDSSTKAHGFLKSGSTYTTLDDPLEQGLFGTFALCINDPGQIVGYSFTPLCHHASLYSTGTYTPLDDPSTGSFGTLATGINNAGQIVGWYEDGAGHQHGFLEITMPNPAPPAATAA